MTKPVPSMIWPEKLLRLFRAIDPARRMEGKMTVAYKLIFPVLVVLAGTAAGWVLGSGIGTAVLGRAFGGNGDADFGLRSFDSQDKLTAPLVMISGSAGVPGIFEQPVLILLSLLAAFAVLWTLCRSGGFAFTDLAQALRDRHCATTKLPAQTRAMAPGNVPRSLIENPFSANTEGGDLATRIQAAITGSLRNGRVLGVIHLWLRIDVDAGTSHRNLLDACLTALHKQLEASLRPGDWTHTSEPGEFIVIIPLLASNLDLQKIADRLRVGLLTAGHELGLSAHCHRGCAMYPIDGYSVSDLFDAAKGRALSAAQSPATYGHLTKNVADTAQVTMGACGPYNIPNHRLAVLQYPMSPVKGIAAARTVSSRLGD